MFSYWNISASTATNLAQAHTPELYVSWLFSIDDEMEFINKKIYYSEIFISCAGEVKLMSRGKVIETLPGVYSYNAKKDTYELVSEKKRPDTSGNRYLDYTDYSIVATIPRDFEYQIVIDPAERDQLKMVELDYTSGWQKADTMNGYTYTIPEDSNLVITFSGKELTNEYYASMGYFPEAELKTSFSSSKGFDEKSLVKTEYDKDIKLSDVMQITRQSRLRLNWSDAVMIVISLALAALFIILFLILRFIFRFRFKRDVKRGWIEKDAKFSSIPLLCIFANVFLFIVMRFYAELLPDNTLIMSALKLAIGIITFLLALYGYLKNKSRLSGFIAAGIAALTIADVVMSNNNVIGSLIHVAAYGLLCYAYMREEKIRKTQTVFIVILSIAAAQIVLSIKGDFGVLRYIAIIYCIAAILLLFSSFGLSRRILAGSVLLFISGLLVFNIQIRGEGFIRHFVSLGVYYLAITVLASATIRSRRYRLIPDVPKTAENG